ncbi:haloacid dehalogenase type II [Fusibacter ferrireducens]|uniref:Haloacid dehalogenase type II n=1 Tax=Fusibacter ferrireducens TaxID=2785058 RepID=A0ABR9ZX39_9FIRM|nr:haloacid dehalogenase type II [Fusibacter ferrireducens]MBF4695024.1 haloacid dehalogenase type II [Fusibacter ferrireducens]
MAAPKAVTFDCYGTLVDWEGEIQRVFKEILANHGITDVDTVAVQRRWEDLQFDYIQEKYRPYTEVLTNTLPMTFKEFDLPFDQADVEMFAGSMGSWGLFPDTIESLKELKKYTKIALITNTDNAIIAQSIAQMGVEFDAVITAEKAGVYKPGHNGFALACKELGLKKEEILHAGFGFKYDVVPATDLGFQTCWINRQGEVRPVDYQETYLVGDMRTFVLMIKGMAESDYIKFE